MVIRYLLFVTYHSILITRNLSLFINNSLPIPSTRYLSLVAFNLLPLTRSPLLVTYY